MLDGERLILETGHWKQRLDDTALGQWLRQRRTAHSPRDNQPLGVRALSRIDEPYWFDVDDPFEFGKARMNGYSSTASVTRQPRNHRKAHVL